MPPSALELYKKMPLGDQRHTLTILRGLQAEGYSAQPLLQAALFHDIAKGPVGLVHRTVVILANALSPSILPRLASADPHSWRHPFYLSLHHPELGAELAQREGLDPRAVTLIRRHQVALPLPDANAAAQEPEPELDRWQRALKKLDDQN